MRTIIKIEHVEERKDKAGRTYWRTYALLDTGEEVVGFGKDFDVDMKVECFFDNKWGQIKMRRPNHS